MKTIAFFTFLSWVAIGATGDTPRSSSASDTPIAPSSPLLRPSRGLSTEILDLFLVDQVEYTRTLMLLASITTFPFSQQYKQRITRNNLIYVCNWPNESIPSKNVHSHLSLFYQYDSHTNIEDMFIYYTQVYMNKSTSICYRNVKIGQANPLGSAARTLAPIRSSTWRSRKAPAGSPPWRKTQYLAAAIHLKSLSVRLPCCYPSFASQIHLSRLRCRTLEWIQPHPIEPFV